LTRGKIHPLLRLADDGGAHDGLVEAKVALATGTHSISLQ
jgi:hypothetical protein